MAAASVRLQLTAPAPPPPPPAGTLLSARHAAERFDACWHGGVATIEALRGQMEALLKEYLSSGDFK